MHTYDRGIYTVWLPLARCALLLPRALVFSLLLFFFVARGLVLAAVAGSALIGFYGYCGLREGISTMAGLFGARGEQERWREGNLRLFSGGVILCSG